MQLFNFSHNESRAARRRLLQAAIVAPYFTIGRNVAALPSSVIKIASKLNETGQQAARNKTPIVLFVTASDCHYCELLRENLFQFLPTDPRFILRELVMDSRSALQGFNGENSSHAELAKRYQVNFSPTVLFVGPNGKQISDPLVGVLTLDYYRYYFEQNLAKAAKLLQTA